MLVPNQLIRTSTSTFCQVRWVQIIQMYDEVLFNKLSRSIVLHRYCHILHNSDESNWETILRVSRSQYRKYGDNSLLFAKLHIVFPLIVAPGS